MAPRLIDAEREHVLRSEVSLSQTSGPLSYCSQLAVLCHAPEEGIRKANATSQEHLTELLLAGIVQTSNGYLSKQRFPTYGSKRM